MPKSIFLFVLLIILNSSCKKEEATVPEETISQKIVKVNWQLYGVFVRSPPDPGSADITELTRYECEKDDMFRFKTDGTFVLVEGSNNCNGTGKSVFSSLHNGDWEANNADSSIRIGAGFNVQLYTVKEISNKLVLEKKESDYFNQVIYYTYYFAPK